MHTALMVLCDAMMGMLSVERKALTAGVVAATPMFWVLSRFYGMLQMRSQGKVKHWNWEEWLEDIEDDQLRFRLRVALEKDEALQQLAESQKGGPMKVEAIRKLAVHADVGDEPDGAVAS